MLILNLPSIQVEELEGKRYYVFEDGSRLPSITTVLSYFKGKELEQWRKNIGEDKANAITLKATTTGTKLHKIIEHYLLNDKKIVEPQDFMIQTRFNTMKSAINKITDILCIEQTLYSFLLGVAGTADCIANYDGVTSIIDFKTSRNIKDEEKITNYFEQASGYSHMFNELTGIEINQIVIIMSIENVSVPKVFIKDARYYIDGLKDKIRRFNGDANK